MWLWLLRNPLQTALGAAALVFFTAAGVQSWRLDSAQAATVKVQAAWDADTAARSIAAIGALNEYRAKEQAWQQQKAQAEADYAQSIADRDRSIAELRRTADELRGLAARAASGNRPASGDDLASCRARAATLADLFGEADAAAGDLAAAADRHANEVVVLLAAWPR